MATSQVRPQRAVHRGDDGYIQDRAPGLRLATLSASGSLEPVSLDGKRMNPPAPTKSIQFSDNLSSGATEFSIPNVDVYDNSGVKHTLKIVFTPDNSIFRGAGRLSVKNADDQVIGQSTLQFLGGIPERAMDVLEFTLEAANTRRPARSNWISPAASPAFPPAPISSLRISKADGYAAGTLSSTPVDENGALVLNYSTDRKNKWAKWRWRNSPIHSGWCRESNGLFKRLQNRHRPAIPPAGKTAPACLSPAIASLQRRPFH